MVAVWRDSREGDAISDIYVATSTDHGASWSANLWLDHAAGGCAADHPALVVSPSGQVCAVWHHDPNGDWHMKVTRTASPSAATGFAGAASRKGV